MQAAVVIVSKVFITTLDLPFFLISSVTTPAASFSNACEDSFSIFLRLITFA